MKAKSVAGGRITLRLMNLKTSWMKTISVWKFGLALLGLVVPACVKEMPDVRPIQEGRTSEQIFQHLGQPRESLRVDGHTVTLHYLGVPYARDFNSEAAYFTGYSVGLLTPFYIAEAVKLPNKAGVYLLACFDNQNRLLRHEEIVGREYAVKAMDRFMQEDCIGYTRLLQEAENGNPESQYQVANKLSGLQREYWLQRAALQGHTGARFELGVMSQSEQGSKWLCLAAHQNHAGAQKTLGDYHRKGTSSATADLVRAYVWYKLAETNGYSSGGWTHQTVSGSTCCKKVPFSEVLAREMTPEELAEAESLFSEWKPSPTECASLAAQ